MGLDVAGVDHKPFKIRFIDQLLQKLLLASLVAPAAEAAMGILPIAIVRRQVAPRRPRAQYPENSVQKMSIVLCDASPLALLSGQVSAQQFPSVIAQIVTVICGCSDTHKDSSA
jgi:hypothetical protein